MRSVIILALAMISLSAAAPVAADQTEWVSVVQVVGAATLDVAVDGTIQRVHLVAIDDGTEPSQPAALPSPCEPLAAVARTRELVDGQVVRLETEPALGDTSDEFGVRPVYVWLADGRNLGEVLLGEGLVRAQLTAQPYTFETMYAAAQANALAKGIGTWAPAVCAPAEA